MDFPSLTLGFLWEGVGGGISFRKRFIVGFSLLFVIFSSFCCGYQSEVDELPAGLEIATGEFCRRILRNDKGGILEGFRCDGGEASFDDDGSLRRAKVES